MIASRTGECLAVISARSDFGLSWAEHPRGTNLGALKRLGRQDVTAMIDSMNAEASLPPTVIEKIIAKAEGLPLFVEEITSRRSERCQPQIDGGPAVTRCSVHIHGSCYPARIIDGSPQSGRADEDSRADRVSDWS